MKKLLIGTALLFAALPFTFDGVTPAISKAQAVYRGIHHRHVVPAAAVGAAPLRVVIPLTQATGAGWGPPPPTGILLSSPTAGQFLCIIRQPAMVATRPPLTIRPISACPGIKLALFLGPARSGDDAEWRDC